LRLDKFLKVARLAKRRSEAKEALDASRVYCEGRALKASHPVRPGDELVIHYATRTVRVRVEAVPEKISSKQAIAALYTVLDDHPHSLQT
jgi:ribosomal 50S subunit-recycling heat shock protein